MTIEADIKTTLDNYAGLFALVGTRNYASHLPQKVTYPCVSYFRISSNPVNHLNGRSVRHNAFFQFDVRGSTYASMRAAVKQLIAALESATLFEAILQDDNDSPFETSIETFRSVVDFSIWFEDN
jgi:hypothetical protein